MVAHSRLKRSRLKRPVARSKPSGYRLVAVDEAADGHSQNVSAPHLLRARIASEFETPSLQPWPLAVRALVAIVGAAASWALLVGLVALLWRR
jgi:hypothetical protein